MQLCKKKKEGVFFLKGLEANGIDLCLVGGPSIAHIGYSVVWSYVVCSETFLFPKKQKSDPVVQKRDWQRIV